MLLVGRGFEAMQWKRFLSGGVWGLALCVCATALGQKSPSSFSFVHITDIQQSARGSLAPLQRLVTDTGVMPIRPSFVVATGDLTEAGRPEEYARLKEGLLPFASTNIGFYAVPGSHETRWMPDGKVLFAKQFGKTFQSFDYEGAHFLLLDSTVRLEHWGHFDQSEIDWLAKDLRRVRPETPIFIFLHHWMGRGDTANTRPIDNEYDLWPLLQGKNVIAIFTGHGQQDLAWKTRGITTVMARGLSQGSYHRVTVSPVMATVERVTEAGQKAEVVAKIPIKGSAMRSRLKAGWNDPNVPYLIRKRPAATLDPRAFGESPEQERGEYRVGDGEWKPLKRDSRDIWSSVFLTRSLPIGMQTATIRIETSEKEFLEEELIFEVEREGDEPIRRWATNLKGGIQSDPIVAGERVFATSLDGNIYALDRENGRQKWLYKTGSEILGSPVVDGERLFVGSTDGSLYAIEAKTGRFLWRVECGGALVSTPAVARGVVCIGGRNKILGVSAEAGKLLWEVPAGDFFQSRATTDGDAFYLGGWDNTLYALDAATGKVRWATMLGFSKEGKPAFPFAPAIASPCVAGGRVFICSNDGLLHTLDTGTGKSVWKRRAPEAAGAFGHSSPVVVSGVVYVASLGERGELFAINAVTNDVVWRMETGQPIYDSSPHFAPDGKSFAIIGVRGKVSVIEAATGKRLWGYELGPGNVFSSPDYDGKTVYTTTMANDVQALGAPGTSKPIVAPTRGRN